ncbi:MAG TPA: DUF2142 domain-containing protein [Acidimicrobiales bacterium]|nr:DUF2142 domain-containing protein [Acidimicrobiales bacterium]
MSEGKVKRGTGLLVFLALWLVFCSWAFATPLFGGPDEPTHSIRAASVARGQILGPGRPGGFTSVTAPAIYDEMGTKISCWVHDSEITATCAGDFVGSAEEKETTTYVGRYNPFYYAAVGVPSLAFPDDTGIYLMRLMSTALAAALFTFAALAAMRARRPPLALLGLAFCLTPMACFLAGVINPNGMEIAAAACLWTAGLLVFDPRTRGPAAIAFTVLGASVLALSRGLSPVWLVLIVALQALAAVPDWGRSLFSDRKLRLPAAVVVVVAGAAAVWIVFADALTVFPVSKPLHGSTAVIALSILGKTDPFLREMIGELQWLDTSVPSLTYAAWFVGVGMVTLLAFIVGRGRVRVAILACAVLTLLTPLLQIPSVRTTGLLWQGRYSLPLAIGIPVLAVYALADTNAEIYALVRRIAAALGVALGVGLVAAFFWAGRRNAVGTDGPFWFLGKETWSPPLPFVLLLVGNAVGVSVLVGLFLKVTHSVSAPGIADVHLIRPPSPPVDRPSRTRQATLPPSSPDLGEALRAQSSDDGLYDEPASRHDSATPNAEQRETS